VSVRGGRLIVLDVVGLASANWIADRNEMLFDMSRGLFLGFTAEVSASVLT